MNARALDECFQRITHAARSINGHMAAEGNGGLSVVAVGRFISMAPLPEDAEAITAEAHRRCAVHCDTVTQLAEIIPDSIEYNFDLADGVLTFDTTQVGYAADVSPFDGAGTPGDPPESEELGSDPNLAGLGQEVAGGLPQGSDENVSGDQGSGPVDLSNEESTEDE